jgi:hypothetical protein
MNTTIFLKNLTLLSLVSPSDAIYEGVTPCALAGLVTLLVPQPVTWCHVDNSRAVTCGVTLSHRLL